jgi:hypothetical protein
MSGQSGAEEKLVGLTDFVEVYETVAATLRRFRGPLSPVQAGEESPADEQVLGAILSELKHIRSILEQSS